MRAVGAREFGALPELLELPRPVPGAGEVLVRLEAAGMNPFDWKILDGILRPRPHVFPIIAGIDGAGTIEATGPGVTRFFPGGTIYGQFLHDPVGTGTYAEYTVVPEAIAVDPIPSGVSPVQAAAIPTAGMTAQDAVDRLELKPGSKLLMIGASGGIGSFAMQLAATRGVEVVALARASSADRLKQLGAREVLDRADLRWPDIVRRRCPQGVDALLDLMSDRAAFAQNLAFVRPGGVAVSTTYAAEGPTAADGSLRTINIDLQPSRDLLRRVTAEVMDRRLTIPVERSLRLDDAPSVLAEIRAGRAGGKFVIVFENAARGEPPG
jgi:NADPH:quinone reductase-like Zn-dependent oxidoreductase